MDIFIVSNSIFSISSIKNIKTKIKWVQLIIIIGANLKSNSIIIKHEIIPFSTLNLSYSSLELFFINDTHYTNLSVPEKSQILNSCIRVFAILMMMGFPPKIAD